MYDGDYFFEKGKWIGKKTIIKLNSNDKIFGEKICSQFSEQNPELNKIFKNFADVTNYYLVHYKKVYKTYHDKYGDEIGGTYEAGLLFAKINGKFLLIGIWDCSVG